MSLKDIVCVTIHSLIFIHPSIPCFLRLVQQISHVYTIQTYRNICNKDHLIYYYYQLIAIDSFQQFLIYYDYCYCYFSFCSSSLHATVWQIFRIILMQKKLNETSKEMQCRKESSNSNEWLYWRKDRKRIYQDDIDEPPPPHTHTRTSQTYIKIIVNATKYYLIWNYKCFPFGSTIAQHPLFK